MSTINYTYNVIVDRFRQFAEGHFQLRRFTHGEISQADLEKEAEWPWLHVKPRAINYSPGTRSFSFEIFISDLPRDKEDKTGYQAESITDCSLIFQDLINEIYLGNMFGDQVVLSRPVNSEPFVEQYTHTLTGVTGIVELNLDYDWSACSIPASWNYNTPTDSPSDGWGALQFIESLDQNGVFVSLLNDEEAPGNSYYYGTNAEGVKGWYQLIDNVGITCEDLPECATIISIVDDIAALQTDVALKANTADLGATAFSNDYNDLDNLPTIPAAQVNSDWNATSGVAEILNKPTIPSIAGLVPETRTLTINGTSYDLSADRAWTISASASLAVGTTPITSGTVGRILFEGTGNVLQESGSLFWDNTNSRLGIGTSNPLTKFYLDGNIISHKYYTNTSNQTIRLGSGFEIFGTLHSSLGYMYYLNPQGWASDWGLRIGDSTNFHQFTRTSFSTNAIGAASISLSSQGIFEGGQLSTYKSSPNVGFSFTSSLGWNFVIRGTSDERLRIAGATGNVLINTTTDAGFKLDVNGTARVQGNAQFGTGFYWDNTNSRLGIGTAAPTHRVNVLGATGAGRDVIKFKSEFSYTGYLATTNSFVGLSTQANSGGSSILLSDANVNVVGASGIQFTTGGSERARFAITTGNFLIGTGTDAGYKLDVNGTARVSGNMTIATANNATLTFQSNNSNIVYTGGAFGIYFNTTRIARFGNEGTIRFAQNIIVAGSTNVAINSSAMLQADSTTKGFLPPRMTTTQKNAIASPASGLVVYDTDLGKLCVRGASAWETITSV